VTGAIPPDKVRQILDELGFETVIITRKDRSEEIIKGWNLGVGIEQMVFSAYITAQKPHPDM
jgi:arsenite methyltransferase